MAGLQLTAFGEARPFDDFGLIFALGTPLESFLCSFSVDSVEELQSDLKRQLKAAGVSSSPRLGFTHPIYTYSLSAKECLSQPGAFYGWIVDDQYREGCVVIAEQLGLFLGEFRIRAHLFSDAFCRLGLAEGFIRFCVEECSDWMPEVLEDDLGASSPALLWAKALMSEDKEETRKRRALASSTYSTLGFHLVERALLNAYRVRKKIAEE